MRSYGEEIGDPVVVRKILRSLPSKFDHVVAILKTWPPSQLMSLWDLYMFMKPES